MKLDRIRVFNSGEDPCQKFYFKDGKLKKQKDVVFNMFGHTRMRNIIAMLLNYKKVNNDDVREIIIDTVDEKKLEGYNV